MKKLAKAVILIFLGFFISLIAMKFLFMDGFFPMHDNTQPTRIFEMAKALSMGQFPVRMVADLGYGLGYPIFNFYAPLPYYIGAFYYLFGFSAIGAAKLMFATGIILAAIFMYLLVKDIAGGLAAIVSSAMYTYAPYHAVNIYVRGAVGEYYAYAFLPLVSLGVWKILKHSNTKKKNAKQEQKSGFLAIVFGLSGIFLSHNITAMIVIYLFLLLTLIFIIYYVIYKKKLLSFYLIITSFILALCLSSFFIIPAFFEKGSTRVSALTKKGSDYKQHFVYLDQLWNSSWGFAGSAPERSDGISFKIGKVHLLTGAISLFAYFLLIRKSKKKDKTLDIYFPHFVIFILSVFFMTKYSLFIWERLPGFSYIQYPWRFLNFSIYSLSVLSSLLFIIFNRKQKVLFSIGLIYVLLYFNLKYFSPQYQLLEDENYYTSPLSIRHDISKISDEYLPQQIPTFQSESDLIAFRKELNPESVKLIKTYTAPRIRHYQVELEKESQVVFDLGFFPGWTAQIDDSTQDIYQNDGFILLLLPAGSHDVRFVYKGTTVQKTANTISIMGIFLLVYLSLKSESFFLWSKKSQ